MSLKYAILVGAFFGLSQICFADGEKTYKEVCSVCHTPGIANAPQLGNKQQWGKLIGEGQVIITAHGYVGVRAMPPKGGKPDLSVEGFSEALNYMVNQSGGSWSKPNGAMLESIKNEIVAREQSLKSTKK